MDHEVEDDVDVEGARGEDAEAVGFKEHGPVRCWRGGGDGRVEALKVAGLNDAAGACGEGDECGRRRRGWRRAAFR